MQQGQFILNTTGAPVSNFTLTQLLDHTVQLVQDNSNIAPSYSISATSNNGLSSAPTPVTAQLCNSLTSSLGCAPKVVRNNLLVKQGASLPSPLKIYMRLTIADNHCPLARSIM